jgi:peptidoglycan-N-acetylglucosamine deacetylase
MWSEHAPVLAAVTLAGLVGCAPAGDPAVVLTFDDDFIEQWHGERERFAEHGVRATFFVTRFDQLTAEELEMLAELQDDGHEIGCHSLTHVDPDVYVEDHSVDDYLAEEVLPAVELMEQAGFAPTAWSYPWGGRGLEMDDKLQEHFDVLRASGTFSLGEQVLYDWDCERLIHGARIDDGHSSLGEIERELDTVVQRGKAVVMYTHRILEESDQSHITPDDLDQVLALIEQSEAQSLTISELVADCP